MVETVRNKAYVQSCKSCIVTYFFLFLGAFVIGVTATDSDIGDNRIITYSLSQPDAAFFNIHAATGVVTVKQAMSSERTYNFQITATDKVSHSANTRMFTV